MEKPKKDVNLNANFVAGSKVLTQSFGFNLDGFLIFYWKSISGLACTNESESANFHSQFSRPISRQVFCVKEMFDQNFDFPRNLRFSTKISSFDQNFNFRTKFQFSTNISVFHETFDFRPKFQFSTKLSVI